MADTKWAYAAYGSSHFLAQDSERLSPGSEARSEQWGTPNWRFGRSGAASVAFSSQRGVEQLGSSLGS